MNNSRQTLVGIHTRGRTPRACVWLAALVLLALALTISPADAQPAFSAADLAGTWRIHVLTGSDATDAPGSTLRGTIQLDATGALVSGTLAQPDGSSTALTGGAFDITPLGVVVGLLSAPGVSDAEIGEARMLVDRQVILGVISGGDLGDVGADFGLVTLVKVTAGFADNLAATWRYHELRTPDTLGQPPVSVVGEMVFDAGTITGGALSQSDGASGTPAGTQVATPDGTFTAAVTGVGAPWLLTGQVASSADLVAGTTSVGAAAAFGLALAKLRVDPEATLATADLAGAWRLYAVALDDAQGNRGTFLRGRLVVNAGGVLVSGSIADDPAATVRVLNAGLLAVDAATGRVTGSVSAATGQTFVLDATLRGSRDLVSGLLTVGGSAPAALGLTVLVREVSVVAFDAATYSVAEGGTAQVTILRTGDTTQPVTLGLRGQGDRFGDQLFPVTFAAGAASRTIGVPTPDDALIGGETVTLTLEDLPAGVLLGGRPPRRSACSTTSSRASSASAPARSP